MFGDVAALAPWEPAGLQLQLRAVSEVELLTLPLEDLRDFFPQLVKRFTRLAREKAAWQQGQLERARGARSHSARARARAGPPERPLEPPPEPERPPPIVDVDTGGLNPAIAAGWVDPAKIRRPTSPGDHITPPQRPPPRPPSCNSSRRCSASSARGRARRRQRRRRWRRRGGWRRHDGAARDGEAAACVAAALASVVAEAEVAPVRVEVRPRLPPRRAPLPRRAPAAAAPAAARASSGGAHHLVDPSLDAAVAAHSRPQSARALSADERREQEAERVATVGQLVGQAPLLPRAAPRAPAPRSPRCAALPAAARRAI